MEFPLGFCNAATSRTDPSPTTTLWTQSRGLRQGGAGSVQAACTQELLPSSCLCRQACVQMQQWSSCLGRAERGERVRLALLCRQVLYGVGPVNRVTDPVQRKPRSLLYVCVLPATNESLPTAVWEVLTDGSASWTPVLPSHPIVLQTTTTTKNQHGREEVLIQETLCTPQLFTPLLRAEVSPVISSIDTVGFAGLASVPPEGWWHALACAPRAALPTSEAEAENGWPCWCLGSSEGHRRGRVCSSRTTK